MRRDCVREYIYASFLSLLTWIPSEGFDGKKTGCFRRLLRIGMVLYITKLRVEMLLGGVFF